MSVCGTIPARTTEMKLDQQQQRADRTGKKFQLNHLSREQREKSWSAGFSWYFPHILSKCGNWKTYCRQDKRKLSNSHSGFYRSAGRVVVLKLELGTTPLTGNGFAATMPWIYSGLGRLGSTIALDSAYFYFIQVDLSHSRRATKCPGSAEKFYPLKPLHLHPGGRRPLESFAPAGCTTSNFWGSNFHTESRGEG